MSERRRRIPWSAVFSRSINDEVERNRINQSPSKSVSSSGIAPSLRHACLCAKAAEEYRGKDIVVLDLRKITPVFDFFVIVTAGSPRQMKAIADEADRLMKEAGSKCLGAEGRESIVWILHDYGDVVFHVFSAEARENYDLERLWGDAPTVDWQSLVSSPRTSADQPKS